MAVLENTYRLPPAVLWQAINDIVEMRKAKIKHTDEKSMVIDTAMYKIKTVYAFRVDCVSPGVTTVAVETDGQSEEDERSVRLMLTTLDSMLGPFME